MKKLLKSLKNNENVNFLIEYILKLIESFYVDNCLTSVNNINELQNFIQNATEAMKLANFDLRGWEYTGDSVLGLSWNKNFDTLSVNVPILSELNV